MKDSMGAKSEGILFGFSVGMAFHLVLIPGLMCLGHWSEVRNTASDEYYQGYSPAFVLLLAGVTQLLYMVPAYLIALARGARTGFLKGLVLAGTLLLLLNVGFCGLGALIS